jgi:type VI secretion system secreted protein VgrG
MLAMAYTFTGREWDKETGLYYYRARYYDPMEGRFISKDPIGFDGGDVNLYGYVGNNPENLTDPSGLAATLPFPAAVDIPGICISAAARATVGISSILSGASAASVPTCDENKQPKGCKDNCDELNQSVKAAKNTVGKLGACKAGMSKYQLGIRYYAWLGLAVARANRDQKCWGGGDDGHQQAQSDAWTNAGNCGRLLQ